MVGFNFPKTIFSKLVRSCCSSDEGIHSHQTLSALTLKDYHKLHIKNKPSGCCYVSQFLKTYFGVYFSSKMAYVPSVLQVKQPQLTDTAGFGPTLLFPLRRQQSPSASTAILVQTQPSNSTEFCHPDVGIATQRKAAGRRK